MLTGSQPTHDPKHRDATAGRSPKLVLRTIDQLTLEQREHVRSNHRSTATMISRQNGLLCCPADRVVCIDYCYLGAGPAPGQLTEALSRSRWNQGFQGRAPHPERSTLPSRCINGVMVDHDKQGGLLSRMKLRFEHGKQRRGADVWAVCRAWLSWALVGYSWYH